MMGAITVLRPEWLFALIPLGLFSWWLLRHDQGLGSWRAAANPELLRAMIALDQVDTTASRRSMAAIIGSVALGIVALSGPAVERRDALSFRNLDAVIFVLDASDSVTEDGRWPEVQTMGRFGIAALGTRPGALILFAGDAYVATDLTADTRQLGQTFSLIEPGTIPDPGSRPERGLDRAIELLRQSQSLTGDVVLFTDGAGLGPEVEARAADIADLGARLSLVTLDPPDALARTLANRGEGRAFGLGDTEHFSRYLGQEGRSVLEKQDYPLLYWRDLGRALLLIAALPLLLLFRRQAQ